MLRCNCPRIDDQHSFYCPMAGNNKPGAIVKATVFRNAWIAPIGEQIVWRDVEVQLDEQGIGATWSHDGVVEVLTRLNSDMDYSFDAPDSLCPIKAHYMRAEELRASHPK